MAEALHRDITSCWLTDEIRRSRPTPLDEAHGGLAYLEETLWDAVPRFLRHLDAALRTHTGRRLPAAAAPVRFGSWMGRRPRRQPPRDRGGHAPGSACRHAGRPSCCTRAT